MYSRLSNKYPVCLLFFQNVYCLRSWGGDDYFSLCTPKSEIYSFLEFFPGATVLLQTQILLHKWCSPLNKHRTPPPPENFKTRLLINFFNQCMYCHTFSVFSFRIFQKPINTTNLQCPLFSYCFFSYFKIFFHPVWLLDTLEYLLLLLLWKVAKDFAESWRPFE